MADPAGGSRDAGSERVPISEGLRPRYCPHCRAPLQRVPGSSAYLCSACGRRMYRNPTAAVAGVLLSDHAGLPVPGRAVPAGSATHVLWVRRICSPRGAWCLPCGHIEYGEEIRSALAREFAEETGLAVAAGEVLAAESNFHDPMRLTVGIWFLARYLSGTLRPGDDADRAAFFPLGGEPLPVAFPGDLRVLARLAGRNQGG